jgi:hypothetical protein
MNIPLLIVFIWLLLVCVTFFLTIGNDKHFEKLNETEFLGHANPKALKAFYFFVCLAIGAIWALECICYKLFPSLFEDEDA